MSVRAVTFNPMHTYAPVIAAELAPMLRRDSDVARRWHSRLRWISALNVKWSILMLEVWCHDMANSIDENADVDLWLVQIHESFIDEWQHRAIQSCLVAFPKPAIALASGAVLGCGVAAVAGASMLMIVGTGLVSVALLGHMWSSRRYLCGPEAHNLCTAN